MRLNFSNATREQIQEGIRRLGAAVKQQMHEFHLSRHESVDTQPDPC
jgi:hypothetical protein